MSVATPTITHRQIAGELLDAGRHVLVEKPIASTVEAAEELCARAAAQGVVLAVGHVERFNPAVQELKRRLDAGMLGAPLSLVARRVGNMPPQIKDADVIVDLAVHDIDIFRYLLGADRPDEIFASAGRAIVTDRFDFADIVLRFGEVTCFLQVNWLTPVKIRALALTGTNGYAEVEYVTPGAPLLRGPAARLGRQLPRARGLQRRGARAARAGAARAADRRARAVPAGRSGRAGGDRDGRGGDTLDRDRGAGLGLRHGPRVSARPLITVIVLCHNYAQYVAGAIDSALAQTYEPVEVLVVDDGSTDDSLAVIERYTGRVRVISQENMGIERTVNRAVGEARGELFALLSADDLFEPRYLEELWRSLERSPDADYAYCRPLLFGAREGPMRCLPFSAYFLVKRTNFVNASALTRTADFLEVGGYREDAGDVALEDWDFWLRMLEAGKRGTYVREPLLRWRRHESGSRNPEEGDRERQALAAVRARARRPRRGDGRRARTPLLHARRGAGRDSIWRWATRAGRGCCRWWSALVAPLPTLARS